MAGIIKAGQLLSGPMEAQPAAFQLTDVSDQANAYIAAARAQAQEIIAAAKREADGLRKTAEQQGMQTAVSKVEQTKRRELATQVQTLLPALEKAVSSFVELRQSWVRRWETEAVRLACTIAGRIVRQEVDVHPQLPMKLLQESLELVVGSSAMRIHLHPDDVAVLADEARRLCQAWRPAVAVEIVSDPEVTKGSCRVTTEFGDIDQRFPMQLARIEQELTF